MQVMAINPISVVAPPVPRDRTWHVELQLENWARWMGSGRAVDKLPTRASGRLENYTTMYGDSDAAHEALDIRLAVTTNAVIAGLEPAEQCALHHKYLSAVYRFNRGQYSAMLMLAKLKLAKGLIAKGVWLG